MKLLQVVEFDATMLNKTKEDFSPVTRPWYIRKKRLLKVLKNKAVYRFSLNFTHGIYPLPLHIMPYHSFTLKP